jgi:hypothetical protein
MGKILSKLPNYFEHHTIVPEFGLPLTVAKRSLISFKLEVTLCDLQLPPKALVTSPNQNLQAYILFLLSAVARLDSA